jgi:hypothetical protein
MFIYRLCGYRTPRGPQASLLESALPLADLLEHRYQYDLFSRANLLINAPVKSAIPHNTSKSIRIFVRFHYITTSRQIQVGDQFPTGWHLPIVNSGKRQPFLSVAVSLIY